jgi:hypothetical protein
VFPQGVLKDLQFPARRKSVRLWLERQHHQKEEAPTGGRGLFGFLWGTMMGEGHPIRIPIHSNPCRGPIIKNRQFSGLFDAELAAIGMTVTFQQHLSF